MYEDLIGKTYGQLTIINIYIKKSGKKNKSFAKCKCSCGNIKDIRLDHIKSGYTSSCGCL